MILGEAEERSSRRCEEADSSANASETVRLVTSAATRNMSSNHSHPACGRRQLLRQLRNRADIPNLQGRPVWVGGGRRGDGIVIAANRVAKKFGIKTGMACFEAKRLCPRGVLCRPHYDEYRRISAEMFHMLEQYSPTLVPISIDEGFLDFTTMDRHVWRNTTPEKYVGEICERISREVKFPVSAGLANSSRLAKLATDAAKPGFIEIKPGEEKEFLKDRSVRELSGIGKNRQRALAALGAQTFGHVAKLPSTAAQAEIRHLGPATLAVCQRPVERAVAAGGQGPHDDFQQHDAALRRAGLRGGADVCVERGDAAGRPVAPRAVAGARAEPDDPVQRFQRSRRRAPLPRSAISKFRHQRGPGGIFSATSWATSPNRCGKSASRSGTWRGWTRSRRFGARPTRNAGARWTTRRTSSTSSSASRR